MIQATEKPSQTSTQNGHQESKNSLSTTPQTGIQATEKHSQTSTQNRHHESERTLSTTPQVGHSESYKPSHTSTRNEHQKSKKPLSTTSQTGIHSTEKPSQTSTQNKHQNSKKALSTTPQTGDPISEKPYLGRPKTGFIIAIVIVAVTLTIIAAVLVIGCLIPKKKKSLAKKAQKGVKVTGNDVILMQPNGLMPNVQTTDQVEYADINLQSLAPRDDSGDQGKASADASKGLVYADLAFSNNTTGGGKVDAVGQIHCPGMDEEDISQLYAKPMKKNKYY